MRWLDATWDWLVAQGLYRDILGAGVAIGVARLGAWRPLRRHAERQERIADLLDTDTPGGMKDVVDELRKRGHGHAGGQPPVHHGR